MNDAPVRSSKPAVRHRKVMQALMLRVPKPPLLLTLVCDAILTDAVRFNALNIIRDILDLEKKGGDRNDINNGVDQILKSYNKNSFVDRFRTELESCLNEGQSLRDATRAALSHAVDEQIEATYGQIKAGLRDQESSSSATQEIDNAVQILERVRGDISNDSICEAIIEENPNAFRKSKGRDVEKG